MISMPFCFGGIVSLCFATSTSIVGVTALCTRGNLYFACNPCVTLFTYDHFRNNHTARTSYCYRTFFYTSGIYCSCSGINVTGCRNHFLCNFVVTIFTMLTRSKTCSFATGRNRPIGYNRVSLRRNRICLGFSANTGFFGVTLFFTCGIHSFYIIRVIMIKFGYTFSIGMTASTFPNLKPLFSACRRINYS